MSDALLFLAILWGIVTLVVACLGGIEVASHMDNYRWRERRGDLNAGDLNAARAAWRKLLRSPLWPLALWQWTMRTLALLNGPQDARRWKR